MILKELVLHDYGPFRGRHTVRLQPQPADGAPRPICLIGALNGSGKTTILDGVLLALYGPRARCSTRGGLSYKDFLRGCIHNRASERDGASLELEFDYTTPAGTTTLRVIRSWHATAKSMTESVRIERDGAFSPGLTETWAQHIEGLIPLGISNLYFFDGEQARELANQRATTENVRQSIRTLLGLDVADRLSQDLRILIARRAKSTNGGDSAVESALQLESDLEDLRKERRLLKEDRAALHSRQQELSQNLETAKQDFHSQGGTIAQQRKQIEQEHREAKQRAESNRVALREAAAGFLPLALVRPLLQTTFNRATQELSHTDSLQTFEMLSRRDELFTRQLKKSEVQPQAMEALLAYLTRDRERRRVDLDGEPYLGVSRSLHSQLEALVNGSLEAETERAVALLTDLKAHKHQVERLERKLAAAAPEEQIEAMLQEMGETQTELVGVEAQIKQKDASLALCEHKIGTMEDQAKKVYLEAAATMTDNSEHQLLVSSADRVQSVMAEFQRVLKNRKIMELESLITERFRHLARKQRMVERIEVDSDDFNLRLYNTEGTALDRTRLSAGEQQLLAISFLWALGLASGRSLPVVIDTPLARMDSKHRLALVERYFPNASHQVILLSTDVEIDKENYRILRNLKAIDQTYLLEFDGEGLQSSIREGYFFDQAQG